MSSVSSGVKEFDVVSCSAIFGSIESVSVGVSGKEEPDSWIWHSSSSVMMSNTASSGGLQTGFIPEQLYQPLLKVFLGSVQVI